VEVRLEKDLPKISAAPAAAPVAKKLKKVVDKNDMVCPKCKEGSVIKGKAAYGCSAHKSGCYFRLPFSFMGKRISDKQLIRILKKGSTIKLKGFNQGSEKVDGLVTLDDQFQLKLDSAALQTSQAQPKEGKSKRCPRCKKGSIVKGKTAFGCNAYKEGCGYKMTFEEIKAKANGQSLTKELVLEILLSND